MIQNNTITATTPSALFTWAPTSLFQATLLTAILLTTLSYQATTVIQHLLLGRKPRHTATPNQLHNLLLADHSTPLSVIAAIARNDNLDALRHRLPYHTTFTRTLSSLTPRPVIALLLLLLTAPIINVITVALAMESDRHLTFADTNVLLALGLGNTTINESSYVRSSCERLHDDFKGKNIAKFFFCSESAGYIPLANDYDQNSSVKVTAGAQGDLTIEIFITGANYSAVLNRYADVSIYPRTYRLAHAIDERTMQSFVRLVARNVQEACNGTDIFTDSERFTVRQIEDVRVPVVVAESLIQCTEVQPDGRVGTSMLKAANIAMQDMLTLVDVPEFLLLDASEIRRNVSATPPWVVGNDFLVMTTREPNAPVLWVAIALGVVLLIRVVVERFTHDDVADGLEAIVASRLDLINGYELLRSEDTIRYDRMLRCGEQLHYGAHRPGWVEVDKFDRPVGVLWQDEECFPESKLDVLDWGESSNTETQDSS